MLVSQLIEFLKEQPQDIQVVFTACSEQCVLEAEDIRIDELCLPRPDRWVQNKRPDMPSQTYLVFPGN